MTTFLRLLTQADKATALKSACSRFRACKADGERFEVAAAAFDAVPGKPFAYWVSEAVRGVFRRLPAFEGTGRTVKQGLATAEDFRFVRNWWEPAQAGIPTLGEQEVRASMWSGFAKGGAYSPFYADVHLVVNWKQDGAEIKHNVNEKGAVRSNVWMLKDTAPNFFLRPGITWPRRTNGLSFRVMPAGCIFADKGPAAFVAQDNHDELLALSCLLNSRAFGLLVSVQLARVELAQSFEVGLIQQTPIPPLTDAQRQQLATLARRAWSLKRTLDTIHETSHAFALPAALRQAQGERLVSAVPTERLADGSQTESLGDYNPSAIQAELAHIQAEIDTLAFDLYGFAAADRQQAQGSTDASSADDAETDDGAEEAEEAEVATPATDALLSWAVGVVFGRFDWRLATGERPLPPEPEPFDALPAKSPGMLPVGEQPFHAHTGILVDDPGHAHDLAHQVEEVLHRVGQPVPDNVRRWLQRDFFAFHLQRYSKSRRKAPIYWPLATASGSYTLWLYAPSLSHETLFTAVNDFLDGPSGKLTQVSRDAATLQSLGSKRSREQEKQFEALQTLELELIDLRALALKIAQNYQPHPDDGTQISAAPLWPLFGHKPWQKLLKDTWAKLEKGDYDWAHLAMAYWPQRVREKCQTDKSLAIAHGLEGLYVIPEAKPKKARGTKKAGVLS